MSLQVKLIDEFSFSQRSSKLLLSEFRLCLIVLSLDAIHGGQSDLGPHCR